MWSRQPWRLLTNFETQLYDWRWTFRVGRFDSVVVTISIVRTRGNRIHCKCIPALVLMVSQLCYPLKNKKKRVKKKKIYDRKSSITTILNWSKAANTNAMTARTPQKVSFCNGFRSPIAANSGYRTTSKRTSTITPNKGTSIWIWSGLIVQFKKSTRPFISMACNVHLEPYTTLEV